MAMKDLYKTEQPLGSDGGKFGGGVGIDNTDLVAHVEIRYPVLKLAEPILNKVDDFLDKIEQLIPGDQKAMAEAAKQDLRAAVLAYIGSKGTEAQPQIANPV